MNSCEASPPGHAMRLTREYWQRADALLQRLPRRLPPDNVHAARVVLRRLRVILSAIAPSLQQRHCARVRKDLGQIARTLGNLRDADIRCSILEGATDPLLAALRADRRDVRRQMRAKLRSPATTALLHRTSRTIAADAFFKQPAVTDGLLLQALRRQCRKLTGCMKQRDDSPAGRHALRIRVKKCRYLVDACGIHPDSARDRRTIATLRRLQDCLGQLNDLEQTLRWLSHQDLPAGILRPQRASLRARMAGSGRRLERLRRKLRPRDVASLGA